MGFRDGDVSGAYFRSPNGSFAVGVYAVHSPAQHEALRRFQSPTLAACGLLSLVCGEKFG